MKIFFLLALCSISLQARADDYDRVGRCVEKADKEYQSCAASCRSKFADPRKHPERMECVQACTETLSEMNGLCQSQND